VGNSSYRGQLIAVGRELYDRGLQTTRSGNISVRDGDQFLITKTGTNLGRLKDSDLIDVDLRPNLPISPAASCESPVHRAIALAEISTADGIQPIHNEGLAGLKWIPVVDTTVLGQDIGEEPNAIAEALSRWCSVVVRSHGAFTVGNSLEQALYKMLLLEDSCRINFLVQGLKGTSKLRSLPNLTPRRNTAKYLRSR
jgi:L-fuculose-phosphate aldolase